MGFRPLYLFSLVILVNNAKGKVNTSDSQIAVCIIMATRTTALQSK